MKNGDGVQSGFQRLTKLCSYLIIHSMNSYLFVSYLWLKTYFAFGFVVMFHNGFQLNFNSYFIVSNWMVSNYNVNNNIDVTEHSVRLSYFSTLMWILVYSRRLFPYLR